MGPSISVDGEEADAAAYAIVELLQWGRRSASTESVSVRTLFDGVVGTIIEGVPVPVPAGS